jgi:hypothetical protein
VCRSGRGAGSRCGLEVRANYRSYEPRDGECSQAHHRDADASPPRSLLIGVERTHGADLRERDGARSLSEWLYWRVGRRGILVPLELQLIHERDLTASTQGKGAARRGLRPQWRTTSPICWKPMEDRRCSTGVEHMRETSGPYIRYQHRSEHPTIRRKGGVPAGNEGRSSGVEGCRG